MVSTSCPAVYRFAIVIIAVAVVSNRLNLFAVTLSFKLCDLGMFGYNTPLYKSTPVKVYMTPEEADNLEEGAKLHLKYTMNGKLDVLLDMLHRVCLSQNRHQLVLTHVPPLEVYEDSSSQHVLDGGARASPY